MTDAIPSDDNGGRSGGAGLRITSLAEMEALYEAEAVAYRAGMERAAAIAIAAPSLMIAYAQIRAEAAAGTPPDTERQ